MGVADGVTMPTIITAHISKTNANSVAFQGAVVGIIRAVPAGIILNPDMSMSPMSISAASQST
jgi:hypothetical protein